MVQPMQALFLSRWIPAEDEIEVVERKGLGHPDTICDALAEALSQSLCLEYRKRFGTILHHNVDKALLCGGRAAPSFGGGTVLFPIHIHLGGRAVSDVGGDRIPITEIAVENSKAWLRTNMHGLDAERHVRIEQRIQPGSLDLQTVFGSRGQHNIPLANDTSIGVGYAPLSPLERLVLAIERQINDRDRSADHPAWGEDVKVMGIRRGATVDLTIACAMIGRHLSHMDDYLAEKMAVNDLACRLAAEHGFAACDITVNSADNPQSVYLTVTGTSAEAGDDGQVGRGNRVNGLITPCRPMSLEAAAGKNPVNHVGKIYNVVAQQIAQSLVTASPEILKAECLLVSKIGARVTEPAIVQIRLATADDIPAARFKAHAAQISSTCLESIPDLLEDFLAGAIQLF